MSLGAWLSYVEYSAIEGSEAGCIRELFQMCDNPHDYYLPLTKDEIAVLLEYLCTTSI